MCDFASAWKKKCQQLEIEKDLLLTENEDLRNQVYKLEHPPPAVERPSPKGEIPRSAVKVYADRVEIRIPNLKRAILTNSNSMEPWDKGHTLLLKEEFDRDLLEVGDIPVYDMGDGNNIIHQVIRIDEDEQGRFYTMQGLNNVGWPDKDLPRNENMEHIVVVWINTYQDEPGDVE
jgi:hypothetical protein